MTALDRLRTLDPECFTVEGVAYVFGTWRWFARVIINTAVRRGEFERIDQTECYRLKSDGKN